MANTVTFEFTETQAKNLENLLDDFNQTMKRIAANEPTRQERMTKLGAEIDLLLSQTEKDLAEIKQTRSRQPKMLWEQ